jgi:hypothetical protein
MKPKTKAKIRFNAQGGMEMWSPARPHIGIQAVQRVLLRHVVTVCPETKLWVAMIAQAIGDAIGRDDNQRHRARRFLVSGSGLGFWCDLIGIDLDFVREVAAKAGYLVNEDALWKPIKSAKSSRSQPRAQALREAACA